MKNLLKDYKILCLLVFIAILIAMTFSITIGSVPIKSTYVWKIAINKTFNQEIFTKTWKHSLEIIIWDLRIPRVITGVIAGGGLALVGILMQCLTKNPLASPYILGISAGASTGAVLGIIWFGSSFISVPLLAFAFSTGTALIVFYFAGVGSFSSTKLVLIGVAVSSFFSGITTLIIHIAPREHELRSALFWMSGSLSSGSWKYIPISFLSLILAIIIIYPKYRELNILVTGEESATVLGVDTKKIRFIIVMVSTFLTGVIVANVGIIGFVGLVIPHITRGLVGGNHKKLMPLAILLGGLFLILTDTLSRTLFGDVEIPIGVITSLFGAPFFLNMLRKNGYRFGGN